LTHFCALIPEPYNDEVSTPDAMISVIHKLHDHDISEFIAFLVDFFADEQIRSTSHILPALRTQLEKNRTAISPKARTISPSEFNGTSTELVTAFFKDTPLLHLFDLKVPMVVPQQVRIEQGKLPLDPNHPKHHCYQCKRRLAADFATQYWQELVFPGGPFFHTEHCKSTALARHRTLDRDYVDAYRTLVKEYNVFVREYEEENLVKENIMREKERVERERIEERARIEAERTRQRELDRQQR